MSRWSEKSPGLKILWLWTFGTAAVLFASVTRTRTREVERAVREQEAAAAARTPSSGAVVLED